MIMGRGGHAAVALDGQIYVSGGRDSSSCEAYDLRADRWRSLKPMVLKK